MRAMRFGGGKTFFQNWRDDESVLEREDMQDLIEWAVYFNFTVFAIGIVLDVVCYKWRYIAKCFYHIEMLLWMTRALIPVNDCVE